ncbi:cyclase [Nocardioides gansuensis]|uniref:Cyclase n=1 Tax=Nocardioides gansuensis TaxID=2138300 RepID=A0A2T8F561_9ACTN|nr:cyclase family protein [Nocardioides gansuensis]PVG80843.1 cyclase [Nocardioides gansuensis]
MRFVELSHVIEEGMTTYPGMPGPELSPYLTFEEAADHYAPGTIFQIARITMIANTGTYLDTPAHRYADGHDLSELPLERVVDLPAVVVDVDEAGTGAEAFVDVDVAGRAILLRSGWDVHWRTERYGDPEHPHLTEDGARHLVDQGAALVGIDSVNIDSTVDGERPAHSLLLRAGIPVVEHLTGLDRLPGTGARFSAVPPRVVGMGTFTVRAYATLE